MSNHSSQVWNCCVRRKAKPKHQKVRGKAARRSGAASDRKGRPIVVSTSTQHAEKEKEKRKGTSPELKNPQTKEKNQFQLVSTDFPGIQWSMRGDELLKKIEGKAGQNYALISAYRHENSHGDKREVRKRGVGRVLLFTTAQGKGTQS